MDAEVGAPTRYLFVRAHEGPTPPRLMRQRRVEYALAERLHKTVQEIRALPNSEWVGWVAYFQRDGSPVRSRANESRTEDP